MLLELLLRAETSGQVLKYEESGTLSNLRSIAFANDSLGLVVGDGGTILRTTDGGHSWNGMPSGTTASLRAIAFGSDSIAIAVGALGTILRTENGGLTWESISSGSQLPLYGVSCHDAARAIVVGANGLILKSDNGGNSWAPLSGPTASPLFAVSYLSAQRIHIVGAFGSVIRSTDGGDSWTRQSYTSSYLYDVAFADSLNGVVVGDNGILMHSSDGGESWSFQRQWNRHESVAFFDRQNGVCVGQEMLSTADAGATWSFDALPVLLHDLVIVDSTSFLGVGNSGAILRSSMSTFQPPAITLAEPEDAALNTPILIRYGVHLRVTLRWRSLYPFAPTEVRLQVATDSAFTMPIHFDLLTNLGSRFDTSREVSRISPFRTYYWRAQPYFGDVPGPWSETRSFTGSVEEYATTIRGIQEVPVESLLVADSLQNSIRSRWTLQASATQDSTVFVTALCVVPASILEKSIWTPLSPLFVTDTGSAEGHWRGIRVDPDPSGAFNDPTFLARLAAIKPGDVVAMAGDVWEDALNDMNTSTSIVVYWFEVIDSLREVPPPIPVGIDQFNNGQIPHAKVSYSTGEQYEGTRVELVDVTVHSVDNAEGGTFNVSDAKGNTLSTSDLSAWYTLRSYRDSNSTYTLPVVGSHIDTLRGFITTLTGGDDPITLNAGRYRILPCFPGDITFGSPRSGVIAGSIFHDLNHNAVWEIGELPFPNWTIQISGKVERVLSTDSLGLFEVQGLDSGMYTIRRATPTGWVQTIPDSSSMKFYLGPDSTQRFEFGLYYQWNTLSGIVFDDLDEDGVHDSTDPGIANWKIHLNGQTTDSLLTDGAGRFAFDKVKVGVHTVHAEIPPHWEKISPPYIDEYTVDFRQYGQHVSGYDFAMHSIPPRVKVALAVRDDSLPGRTITFGVRPGASYGIWGASPSATNQDFAEGETEIPPRIFGIFDVRLEDPHFTGEHFGEGSWIDMRPFISSSQADTYLVRFQPAYLFGGGYPMTLQWSTDYINQAYLGSVTMTNEVGEVTDMKSVGSLIVTHPASSSVRIVTNQPVLQIDDIRHEPQVQLTAYALGQNYPNPFNPATTIEISTPAFGHISLKVYDVLGREVASLIDQGLPAGVHAVTWNAGSVGSILPSGVYFYRVQASGFSAVRKMLYLR